MEDQSPPVVQQAPPVNTAPVEQDSMQALIPTKNKPALFSYYAGVFGLIPILGLLASVAAIVLGLIGLKRYKLNPTPGAKSHAMIGLVLGVFEIIVFIGFIVFVLLLGD